MTVANKLLAVVLLSVLIGPILAQSTITVPADSWISYRSNSCMFYQLLTEMEADNGWATIQYYGTNDLTYAEIAAAMPYVTAFSHYNKTSRWYEPFKPGYCINEKLIIPQNETVQIWIKRDL